MSALQSFRKEQAKFVKPIRRHSDSSLNNFKKLFVENTNEFCNNTTLHGLKYVADKQLHPIERIFFTLSFIAVVVVSMFFISSAYSKWRSTPVILSLNPEPTSITEDPFPAVTICNLNQALKSKAKSYKKNTTEYEILKIICGHKSSVKNASVPINDWKKLDQVIIDVSQPCSRLLISCRFGAINYDCKTIFRPIVTDAGLCCVFNMVHPEFMYIPDVNNIENISYTDGSTPVDWDPEHGYPKNLPPQYYPRTAVGTGENLGFTVMLNLEPDEYYCSSSNGMGFKIFLHSPTETPHVKEVGLFLAAGMESKLRIHAEKFETDLKLRSMRKDYRKCLFDTEGDLVYFSYYTKRNCEMECLTNMIMKHCGCVTYYMPRMYKYSKVCSVKDEECVEKYRRLSMMPDDQLYDCHDLCWPSCFDLTFDPYLFSIPISHHGFTVDHPLIDNMSSEYASNNIAIAHMFFKETTYRSSRQTEFIGTTDFLSSTGGLMGLFVGFSFISLAEFIYYALIRPYYNMRRRRLAKTLKNKSTAKNSNLASQRHSFTKQLYNRFNGHFGDYLTKSESKNMNKIIVTPNSADKINFPIRGDEYYILDVNKWIARKSHTSMKPLDNYFN